MIKTFRHATLLLAVFAAGIMFEHVRAQSNASLADAQIGHIGISVSNVDKVIERYTSELQATHAPVHEIKGLGNAPFPYPESSKADRNAYVRTSEIKLNGFEIHLMQAVGGASPWRDHREKYGEGSLEHVAFAVKDVPAVANALIAKGGKVLVGKPEMGFCYIQMPDLPFIIEMYRSR